MKWFTLVFVVVSSLAQADVLSELSSQWQEELDKVPEADISGVEPSVQRTIRDSRTHAATLLLQNEVDKSELAEAYGDLGALYHLHNIDTPADTCYENARVLAPQDFRWVYYAAFLALETGRAQQAVERFQQAKKLRSDYAPLMLREAQAFLDINRLEDAHKDFLVAVKTPGLRASASFGLGQIALLGRRYEQAIERFNTALALEPEAKRIHYPLAQALRAVGRREEAREHLTQRGDGLPSAEDPLIDELQGLNRGARRFFLQGLNAVQQGNYTVATTAFAQGLEYDPDNVAARVSYARALFLAGESAKARGELQAALQRDKEYPLAIFLIGILNDTEGQQQIAAEDYRRVLAIAPGHAGAHYYLANLYMRSEKYPDAAKHYEESIKGDPNNAPAYVMWTFAQRMSNIADAKIVEHLNAAIKRFPDMQVFKYALAGLLAVSKDPQAKNPGQALELAKILAETLDIPPHIEMLAVANAANGQYDRAIQLQQFLIRTAYSSTNVKWLGQLLDALSLYQQKKMPLEPWPGSDRIFAIPQVDAHGPFREYPAIKPF